MDRPEVRHAGCGGTLVREQGVLLCAKCHAPIIDARELAPRPKVAIERPYGAHLDYMEQRSRYLGPATGELF